MTTQETPLRDAILSFVESPESCLFEDPYYQIWMLCESDGKLAAKTLLLEILKRICDNMVNLPADPNATEIQVRRVQIEYFRAMVTSVAALFVHYDSVVDAPDRVIQLAVDTAISTFFGLESFVSGLQKEFSAVYSALLQNPEQRPEIPPSLSLFFSAISTDLYARIFTSTLQSEAKSFFERVTFSDQPLEIIEKWTVFSDITDHLATFVQSPTLAVFKEVFWATVVLPVKPALLELEPISAIAQSDDSLHKLFSLISLGPSSAVQDLSSAYSQYLRVRLDAIASADFGEFAGEIGRLHEHAARQCQAAFESSPEIDHVVHNVFDRFLRDHNFCNSLVIALDKDLVPHPFVQSLVGFLGPDTEFAMLYSSFMGRRLLADPTVDKERTMLSFFETVGLPLPGAQSLLADFENAQRVCAEIGLIEVNVIGLRSACWPHLAPLEFTPPPLFTDLFFEACAPLREDCSAHARLGMSGGGSTVEFSDGNVAFSLQFRHACIVHLVLESGGMPRNEVLSALAMPEAMFEDALAYLVGSNTLRTDGGMLSFVGPPTMTFQESAAAQVVRDTQELSMGVDPQWAIQAQVIRFLKSKQVAGFDAILAAVTEMVPPGFVVTRENTTTYINKLVDQGLIGLRAGRTDVYRWVG
jgi:hypothetical protein